MAPALLVPYPRGSPPLRGGVADRRQTKRPEEKLRLPHELRQNILVQKIHCDASDVPPLARKPPSMASSRRTSDDKGGSSSLFRRAWCWLDDCLIEPLATARRFLHLCLIFLPVIAAAPMLLLEYLPRTRSHKERATTKWWYSFLVKQMERAGPTFIKVGRHPSRSEARMCLSSCVRS